VAYRDEHGPFASVDQLEDVSGIGPSTLEELRDLVTI
jgi:competence protein ComEA